MIFVETFISLSISLKFSKAFRNATASGWSEDLRSCGVMEEGMLTDGLVIWYLSASSPESERDRRSCVVVATSEEGLPSASA